MAAKLDVIIFGASGFTGKRTVFEAITVLHGLQWGIAGRNREKLEAVLKEFGRKANKDLSKTPIIIADSNDQTSLKEMASRCRVLVNCCGPYHFYGEPVVRACIEAGTHHVDVSGEPQYMETMQLKYNQQAQERGVYVISACGFGSIPADMGIVFIEKNFDGVVNSVETYIKSYVKGEGGRTCASINYGTWVSAIFWLADSNEMTELRSKLYPEKLPEFEPVLQHRPFIFQSEIVNGVCLPCPPFDRSVVMRSQRFLYENERKRPVQMHAYVSFPSWIMALVAIVMATIFGIMSQFVLGRRLLLKYPRFFSLGSTSHEGPSDDELQRTQFEVTMKAMGWPKCESLAEPTDQYIKPPSKSLTVKVSGSNPGYGATCVSLLCAASTILKESDKMPGNGGVLPPGAAFAKTDLINNLEKYEHGMKFEILADK